MPANEIRRSDDKVTEKYDKFAEKLGKFQENLNIPKFYEYGKSVAYQEKDISYLPTFTTNMIVLSQLSDENLGSDIPSQEIKDDAKTARATRRRIVAQLDLDMDDSEFFEQDDQDTCPECGSENVSSEILNDKYPYTMEDDKPLPEIPFICYDCGNSFTQKLPTEVSDSILEDQLEEKYPFPFGGENDERDIFSSIETMLPSIIAKPNQKMNKMSANIVSGLINSLDIDDGQKSWFNAQIENGVLNADIFMRNLKTAMSEKPVMNKESQHLPIRYRKDRMEANRIKEKDPRYTLGDRTLRLINPYEYKKRTEQEIAGGKVEKSNTAQRFHQDKSDANELRKQDPKYTLGDRILRFVYPYEYSQRTMQEIGSSPKQQPLTGDFNKFQKNRARLRDPNSLKNHFNSDPGRLQKTVQKLQNNTPDGGTE